MLALLMFSPLRLLTFLVEVLVGGLAPQPKPRRRVPATADVLPFRRRRREYA